MKLEIKFNLDSDAFQECPEREITAILKTIYQSYEDGLPVEKHSHRNIYDSNGNVVGTFTISDNI